MITILRRASLLALVALLCLTGTAWAQADCTLSSEGDYIDAGYEARITEDYEAAVTLYTCALNINAKNPDSLFGRAYSNDELGNYDQAMADYNALLDITPDDGAALNNRGNIFYERGDYE